MEERARGDSDPVWDDPGSRLQATAGYSLEGSAEDEEEEEGVRTDRWNGGGPSLDDEEEPFSGSGPVAHWMMVDAFHLAVWCVVRSFGPALPALELWSWRAILQLTPRRGEGGEPGPDMDVPWRGLDEAELLLHLCLRKPEGYTLSHLERRYGGHLHVYSALSVLEKMALTTWRDPVEGGGRPSSAAPRAASCGRQPLEEEEEEEEGDGDGAGGKVAVLKRFDGRAVARLMEVVCRRPCRLAEKGGAGSPAERELLAVLSSVRVVELRRFAVALHRCCGASREPSTPAFGRPTPPPPHASKRARSVVVETGAVELHGMAGAGASEVVGSAAESVPDAGYERGPEDPAGGRLSVAPAVFVPTRKADLIHYLMACGYCPSGGPSAPADEPARLVAAAAAVDQASRTRPATKEGEGGRGTGAGGEEEERRRVVGVCWDVCVGAVVLVQPDLRRGVRGLVELVDALVGCDGCPGGAPRRAPRRPSAAAAAGSSAWSFLPLPLPHGRWGALRWAGRAWCWDGPPPWGPAGLVLCECAAELEAYRAALRLHQLLHASGDGATTAAEKARGRCRTWVTATYRRVTAALETAAEASPEVTRVVRQRGFRASHLLQLTARYRWYACLELLYPLLHSLRLYGEAIACLEHLLQRPLLEITGCVGGVRVGFYYRYVKRGKWWHDLALHCVRLGQPERGLQILEREHGEWSRVWAHPAEVKAAFQELLEGTTVDRQRLLVGRLPPSVQRRARVLRSVWPEPNTPPSRPGRHPGSGEGAPDSTLPAAHAVFEYLLGHFCRRRDRVGIERTMGGLHRRLRRWTPAPASRHAFTAQLRPRVEVKVVGERDPVDRMLWRDLEHGIASTGVEDYVLQHYVRLWSGPAGARAPLDTGAAKAASPLADTWQGLHCEGRWVELLARILFLDVYYYPLLESGTPPAVAPAVQPDLAWLSPLQSAPLDALCPLLYAWARRDLIERRLEFLSQCSTAELVRYAAARSRGTLSSAHGPGESDLRRAAAQCPREGPPPGWASAGPPEAYRVPIGSFPLLSLLCAIPRAALVQLMRYLFLQPLTEGYCFSTSGFPDLVLWRCPRPPPGLPEADHTGGEGTAAAPRRPLSLADWLDHGEGLTGGGAGDPDFRLVEVKSPQDVLSTGQITVLDCLQRCGFDACVAHVVERAHTPSWAPCKVRSRRS